MPNPTNKLNLVGKRFARLIVLTANPVRTRAMKMRWDVRCDCGSLLTVIGAHLANGTTKSCGCLKELDRSHDVPATIPGATWIPIGHKKFALVSDADAPRVSGAKWCPSGRYASGAVDGRRVFMHCFILGLVGVDHKNGDGLDNRRSNLRPASQQQNCRNQRKTNRPKTSTFKGVAFHQRSGKWQAHITVNRKQTYLGVHSSERDAALAYNTAAKRLFGEFALLNEVSP